MTENKENEGIEEKQHEQKLFKEYFGTHSNTKDPITSPTCEIPATSATSALSEKQISNEIDKQMMMMDYNDNLE